MAQRRNFSFDPGDPGAPNPRTKPHNIEAEKGVLAAMLLDEEALDDIMQGLKAGDFYAKAHQSVFAAIEELATGGEQVDSITVGEKLNKSGHLEKIGGMSFLADLTDNVPGIAIANHYAKIVKENSQLRRLFEASLKVQNSIFENSDISTALEIAESEISGLSESRVKSNENKISDIMSEVVDDYEKRKLGYNDNTGITTHYDELMKLLGGFRGGEMIILAARPSMGKTTCALNLIYDFAAMQQQAVIFFSLEMGKKQIVNNLVCRDSDIDSHLWLNKTRNLEQKDHTKLSESFQRLSSSPILIDDDPWLTPSILHAKLRRYRKDHDIKAVVIDYLQLMNSPDQAQDSRAQEISHISRSVKAISREMDLPIIALAQLNRSVEGRASKRPSMSDLRESGSIEQDADVIILIHRPDYYDEEDRPGEVDLIVAKHRNGPTGTASLFYTRNKCRFENLQS